MSKRIKKRGKKRGAGFLAVVFIWQKIFQAAAGVTKKFQIVITAVFFAELTDAETGVKDQISFFRISLLT